MAKKPTIRDIARLASVSKSTVSRVLNNSAKVDPITRERIQRVITEQGFVPDQTAMQLARGDRQLIGMLLPAFWSFMPEIIQGIAGVVEENGYEIILYSAAGHKDFRTVVDRMLTTKLIAGLLATIHTHSPQHLITLSQRGLPIVMVNMTAIRLDIPWVSVDNAGGDVWLLAICSLWDMSASLFSSPTLIYPAFMIAIMVTVKRYGKSV